MAVAGAIAVVDYGMGNLRSVWQALVRVAAGREVLVTSDPEVLARAERIVFPGQGAMPDCMRELEARGLRPALIAAAQSKPFFGICIGQQMLFEHSEEGDVPGLGIFPGRVRRFSPEQMYDASERKLKVPHMGWNEVQQSRRENGVHPLWQGIADNERFYFVHSYYVEPGDAQCVAGETRYGERFTSAVARDNIFAVQFHPEKSARAGLALLANFIRWQP
ncbi:MAG: imidazole glycerol phosphate synthase subunit HisH [Pseudomonadota bacterium]